MIIYRTALKAPSDEGVQSVKEPPNRQNADF